MNLQPLNNNLLIEGTSKVLDGIIIPDSAKERPTTGIVKAVGEEVRKVKVGERVLVKGYMVDEVEIDEIKYLLCQEDGVIGKIYD